MFVDSTQIRKYSNSVDGYMTRLYREGCVLIYLLCALFNFRGICATSKTLFPPKATSLGLRPLRSLTESYCLP